ncbi:hypothetical protein L6164_008831 [Bauhinia variegata]|uniref:Uncharacterized protein n=1 Tax=Bauhinia variegata TaxID=167791 RepID=A0ACB9PJD9_BAUVA|nr:hypothetical protein L6164_008831 [Bauhinia variegata]
MVRDSNKLYVTVPSLFRCPISMDVMRSPVSLCTGVTYDRSSIQNWLDSGHNTCPATKQVLPSKDVIPNLTVHRLINLWLRSGDRSLASSSSPAASHSLSAVSIEDVRNLIRRMGNDNEDIAILLPKILEFASYSDENRRLVANFPGFDSEVVRIFSKNRSVIGILETAIRVLGLITRENEAEKRVRALIFDSTRDCLSSLVSILQNGAVSSKIETLRFLESLAGDVQSKRSIAETPDLLSVQLNLLRSESKINAELHDAVLSCLIALSATQSTKMQLIRVGLVRVLSDILQNPTCSKSRTEKCLKLLATVSTFAEGRSAISEEWQCVEAVVEKLVKVTNAAVEDAVAVLWNICCLSRNVKVQEEVAKGNGVTKILLVLQRDCEEHVKKMCRDLVKVLRAVWKVDLGSYETKTTHIKPC